MRLCGHFSIVTGVGRCPEVGTSVQRDGMWAYRGCLGQSFRAVDEVGWVVYIYVYVCAPSSQRQLCVYFLLVLKSTLHWIRMAVGSWASKEKEKGNSRQNYGGWECWPLLCRPAPLLNVLVTSDHNQHFVVKQRMT